MLPIILTASTFFRLASIRMWKIWSHKTKIVFSAVHSNKKQLISLIERTQNFNKYFFISLYLSYLHSEMPIGSDRLKVERQCLFGLVFFVGHLNFSFQTFLSVSVVKCLRFAPIFTQYRYFMMYSIFLSFPISCSNEKWQRAGQSGHWLSEWCLLFGAGAIEFAVEHIKI